MIASKKDAFSLVEITLAIGVASFCLLAVLALFPTAQRSIQNSGEQTAAVNIASEIVSDLRATLRTIPASIQTSPRFSLAVPAGGTAATQQTIYFAEGMSPILPPDTPAAGASPTPRYRATVFLAPPANATSRSSTIGRVLVTWPALADPVPASTPAKYNGALEVLVALDRN
jgi:type II secretory pathway pseudopilin PulG